MLQQRVAQQRDKVAAAARRAKQRAGMEQVWQRVLEEEWESMVRSDVDLHCETQPAECLLTGECVDPMQDNLELQAVLSIDEREDIKDPLLCMPLQDSTQRGPASLLDCEAGSYKRARERCGRVGHLTLWWAYRGGRRQLSS